MDRLIRRVCSSLPQFAADLDIASRIEPFLRDRLRTDKCFRSRFCSRFVGMAHPPVKRKILDEPDNKEDLRHPKRTAF